MPDATIEIIEEITKHPNADKLDICSILGFKSVSAIGQYKPGEKIVFVKPDSVLPLAAWAESYRKYAPKRVKAMRLRNEWSEGLIIPFKDIPEEAQVDLDWLNPGDDVSELLNISHYVHPVDRAQQNYPKNMRPKGNLPLGISKTDEERVESLKRDVPWGATVDVQLKIDGESCTFYYDYDTKMFGTLSRQQELIPDTENRYTMNIGIYDIQNKLTNYCEKEQISLAIRGESYGLGLQNHSHNAHSKMPKGWAMFSVWLIKAKQYANKGSRYYFKNVANEIDLPICPMVEENVILTKELVKKYSIDLEEIHGLPFEGVVIKHEFGSFKVINKLYDSKK